MVVATKHQAELPRIKECVNTWHSYFKDNIDTFHQTRSFVFKSQLNANDLMVLEMTKKPKIEFNILEAYVSRLRGEFSKQLPSLYVTSTENSKVDPVTEQIVEDHLRAVMFYASKNSALYTIYTDLLSGGFSAAKVWTAFEHEKSFNQNIYWDRVYDPTLCGFDPLARLSHKGDGRYCFELFPKRRKEFEEEYPTVDTRDMLFTRTQEGFSWSYNNQKEDVIIVCDFYEKKNKRTKIVMLADGQVLSEKDYKKYMEMWTAAQHIEQPAKVIGERWTNLETIVRYRFVENEIIEFVETDFKLLPIVFIDGNSMLLRDSTDSSVTQVIRPYVYNALGAQKLKNFAGQCLANELENMVQHKFIMSEESISPEYRQALLMPQLPSVVIWKELYNNDPKMRLTPPREVQRPPIPQEVTGTFMLADQMTQGILGSYDASLGINNNQLSGVAIVEGATQSNAAAMPYIVSLMQSLTQIGQIYIDLFPKYYATPRTIPTVGLDGKHAYLPINQPGAPQLQYDDNSFKVSVEAGVNFSIQKSKSLMQITSMMQASQTFQAFINENMQILVKNMEIEGQEQFEAAAEAWTQKMKMMQQQQQQMAQQQPNPMMMKLQNEQKKIQNEQQKNQLAAAQLQQDGKFDGLRIMNEIEKTANERMNIQLKAQNQHSDQSVQLRKADAEEFSHAADLAMRMSEQQHKHAHDDARLAHDVYQSTNQQNENST